MYKVIKTFTDLQGGGRYNVGDVFPHDGVTVTEDRLKKLSSNSNRQGVPLIAKVNNKRSKTVEDLNPAIPSAQPEEVVQEAPSQEEVNEYKPKRNNRKNKED